MELERIEGYRLSPQQRRLWLLGPRPYVSQCALLLEGPLGAQALQAALGRLAARHEALRTRFRLLPGMELPLQVVEEAADFPLRRLDLEGEPEGLLDTLLAEERAGGFDYGAGPLVRACLACLGGARHALVLTASALCADAAALRDAALELGRHYAACAAGEGAEAAEVVQYVQYAEWQHELLGPGAEEAEGRRYWEQRPAPAPPALPLEAGGGGADYRTEATRAGDEEEAGRSAAELAARGGVAEAAALLACWQTLLRRLSGANSFTVEAALDGRKYEEMQGAVGVYAKWLPLHCRVEAETPFAEVLAEAEESLNAAYARHEYYDPADPRAAAGDAHAVGFDYLDARGARQFADLKVNDFRLYSRAERHKLRLTCLRTDAGLRLELHYDPAVYGRETAERMAASYLTLVRAAAARTREHVGRLPVLGEKERRQLIEEWNDTGRDYPRGRTVHALFAEQAGRAPDAEAVACEGERLTYRRLDERSNQLARHLRSLG
ncbi:MAG TPA: condensation domain-containing protein, partial [Pyrinomonadaceae bacterium]|nr:condensation domain-containing protein [Pyrinomonadaceae bacterium]